MSAPRSKRTPLDTKKTGMNTPKPIASSLRRSAGCVIAAVGVGEREHGSGRERAEDHLEAEMMRGGGEADEQDQRAAHADLGRGVLEPQEVHADAQRALRAAHDEQDRVREREQRADQHQPSRPARPRPRTAT